MCVCVSVLAFCALTLLVGQQEGHLACKKTECWGTGVVMRLERGADLHMAQQMPLPLTVSCFSKIQIGFSFLVLAHPVSPRQRAVKRVCVCVCQCFRIPVSALVYCQGNRKGMQLTKKHTLLILKNLFFLNKWRKKVRGQPANWCLPRKADISNMTYYVSSGA